MKGKTFNISIPEDLSRKADAVARREYRSRSELIREALRKYIQDIEEWDKLMAYGRGKARQRGVTTEAQVNKIVREYRHGRKK